MLRKNSFIKFALLTIIAILGVLLCVCPFAVPNSTSNFNGFAGAINKGIELDGGVSAIYECKLPEDSTKELTAAVDNSLEKIEMMFNNEGYTELVVSRQGGNKVSILASGATENDYAFDFIANRKVMSFTLNKYEEGVLPTVYMTSSAIAKVRPTYDYEAASYGVVVDFSNEGKAELEDLKKKAEESRNSTVYIYLGEINAENLFAEVNYKDLKGDSTFLSSSSITDGNTATEAAYSIASGSIDVELTLKEVASISAVFGKNTMLYIGICLILVIVGAMTFMYVRYGHLGLLANLALVFYLVIYTFLLQAIPFIVLNLATVVGSIVAFVLAIIANVVIFEKIKEEYALGKKIHLSCKGGFKKALWAILDSHILIVIASAFIWIFAPASLKVFAIAIIAGAFVSAFASLVLTRYFVKIYLPLNSSKPRKLRLYRDKNIKEIKDEEVEIIPEDASAEVVSGGNNED